jgi:hypothetical protein
MPQNFTLLNFSKGGQSTVQHQHSELMWALIFCPGDFSQDKEG